MRASRRPEPTLLARTSLVIHMVGPPRLASNAAPSARGVSASALLMRGRPNHETGPGEADGGPDDAADA